MHGRTIVGIGLLAAGLGSAPAGRQAPPGTDVFLVPIALSPTAPAGATIGVAANVTRRAGYDNQPAFTADSRALLFTSVRADAQADIYRYDIASKQTTRVTSTAESEYSATMMPGGRRFSVVRVEADSTQRLWSFALDGSDPQLVLRTIKPVGYHAWLDSTHLVAYVLGRPATLQVVDTRSERADTVARDIDRSLSPIARGSASFVLRDAGGALALERVSLDAAGTPSVARVAALPPGAAFVVWTPAGMALTASGSKILMLQPGETNWAAAADLAAAGVANISRLAISPNGRWLALVANDTR
jgi:hypothetical protein